MEAKRKPIAEYTLTDLGLEGAKPRLRIVGYEEPPARAGGVVVESVDELMDKLANEAKVI